MEQTSSSGEEADSGFIVGCRVKGRVWPTLWPKENTNTKKSVFFMKAAQSHITLTVKLLCQFIFMSRLEETYTYLQL